MNNQPPYSTLATAYDRMLRHVDYNAWYSFISTMMIRTVPNPRKVLELGCGTGKFCAKFSADNFEITGIDRSIDMLRVAKTRSFKKVHIFCADMRNFALKEPVDFIFCVHDTMNYLLSKEDLRAVFRCAKAALKNDGTFLFDITTEYNISHYFEDKTQTYCIGGRSISWSNTYDREKSLVRSHLIFDNKDGSKSEEIHIQKIYTIEEIKKLLNAEGLEMLSITGDYGFDPPDDKTIMINFTAGKRK